MNAYDVMDSLLRTSLVEHNAPSMNDFEVELALLNEGDAALCGLWYAINGRSLIFCEDEQFESWLTEAGDPLAGIPGWEDTPEEKAKREAGKGHETPSLDPEKVAAAKKWREEFGSKSKRTFGTVAEPAKPKQVAANLVTWKRTAPKKVEIRNIRSAIKSVAPDKRAEVVQRLAKNIFPAPKDDEHGPLLPGSLKSRAGAKPKEPGARKKSERPSGDWGTDEPRGKYVKGVDDPGDKLPDTDVHAYQNQPDGPDGPGLREPGAVMHKALRTIAGITNSHDPTKSQHDAVHYFIGIHHNLLGRQSRIPMHQGGHENPLYQGASDHAQDMFLGIHATAAHPYEGIINVAKKYVAKWTDKDTGELEMPEDPVRSAKQFVTIAANDAAGKYAKNVRLGHGAQKGEVGTGTGRKKLLNIGALEAPSGDVDGGADIGVSGKRGEGGGLTGKSREGEPADWERRKQREHVGTREDRIEKAHDMVGRVFRGHGVKGSGIDKSAESGLKTHHPIKVEVYRHQFDVHDGHEQHKKAAQAAGDAHHQLGRAIEDRNDAHDSYDRILGMARTAGSVRSPKVIAARQRLHDAEKRVTSLKAQTKILGRVRDDIGERVATSQRHLHGAQKDYEAERKEDPKLAEHPLLHPHADKDYHAYAYHVHKQNAETGGIHDYVPAGHERGDNRDAYDIDKDKDAEERLSRMRERRARALKHGYVEDPEDQKSATESVSLFNVIMEAESKEEKNARDRALRAKKKAAAAAATPEQKAEAAKAAAAAKAQREVKAAEKLAASTPEGRLKAVPGEYGASGMPDSYLTAIRDAVSKAHAGGKDVSPTDMSRALLIPGYAGVPYTKSVADAAKQRPGTLTPYQVRMFLHAAHTDTRARGRGSVPLGKIGFIQTQKLAGIDAQKDMPGAPKREPQLPARYSRSGVPGKPSRADKHTAAVAKRFGLDVQRATPIAQTRAKGKFSRATALRASGDYSPEMKKFAAAPERKVEPERTPLVMEPSKSEKERAAHNKSKRATGLKKGANLARGKAEFHAVIKKERDEEKAGRKAGKAGKAARTAEKEQKLAQKEALSDLRINIEITKREAKAGVPGAVLKLSDLKDQLAAHKAQRAKQSRRGGSDYGDASGAEGDHEDSTDYGDDEESDKEESDKEESCSLFGAIFTESRRGASLFEAVLA